MPMNTVDVEIAFIKDCRNVQFASDVNYNVTQGPDHSTTMNIYKSIDDRPETSINYHGHWEHGRGHSSYGPQATRHGPLYDSQGKTPAKYNSRKPNWVASSQFSENDVAGERRGPSRGPYPPYLQPGHFGSWDQAYHGRNSATSMRGPRRPNTIDKGPQTGFPGGKERPNWPLKELHQTFPPDSQEEHDFVSPWMKKGQKSLNPSRDTANLSLAQVDHDPARQWRRSQWTESAKKGFTPCPFTMEPEEEGLNDDGSGGDEDLAIGKQSSSSPRVRNKRVMPTSVNSHNITTESVVNSYNDNFTCTIIRKA